MDIVTPTIHPISDKNYNNAVLTLYEEVRARTEEICSSLEKEDYVVQPATHVSPAKWHLAHTTWFFETFILKEYQEDYQEYHASFNYLFNSYYEAAGDRVVQANRGNMSRPTVDEIYRYRKHVNQAMQNLLHQDTLDDRASYLIEVGCHHEQQHQELLITDLKYLFGHNPLFPEYLDIESPVSLPDPQWITVDGGLYDLGHAGDDFHYDNEAPQHKIYLEPYEISNREVTNGEYLEFIKAGGYRDSSLWHGEGWDWAQKNNIQAPLYWHKKDEDYFSYDMNGLQPIDADAILKHVSFYEAFAYAEWKGLRLPTEGEWEVAADRFEWGRRWEWTASAYTPYPGYVREEGALGEYNGKFMVSQQVLRGSSVATSEGHARKSYRNFFHPLYRWQYTGIRLAK